MSSTFAVAVDLGGTYIKGGVVDDSGAIVHREKIATGDPSFDRVCDQLAKLVQELKGKSPAPPVGVGIAVPGGIYNDRETISQSPNFPDWKDVNLIQALETRNIGSAWIENDANLAAFGEHWKGAGQGVNDLALFTLGTGVGGGLILNGRIWRGNWGMAGELGHITVDPEGPLCGCGNRGCLESLANNSAIAHQGQTFLEQGRAEILAELVGNDSAKVTPELMSRAADAGDQDCAAAFAEAGRWIGIAIADLLNALNLPLFLIGGGMGAAFSLMADAINSEVATRAFRIPAKHVRIAPAKLGNDAGTLGAAKLAFDQGAS
jgi:glucokinase